MNTNRQNVIVALKEFLSKGTAESQQEICQFLQKQGLNVNQAKISRLLRKLGIVKIKNERGKVIYWLPKEPPPPEPSGSISSLVKDIAFNESMIIVHTIPGAAQVIARLLDYWSNDSRVLGTIAGDDSILVVPKTVADIKLVAKKISTLLAIPNK